MKSSKHYQCFLVCFICARWIVDISAQEFEWAKRAGGGSMTTTHGIAICTDNVGNAYITGTIRGGLIFDSDTLLIDTTSSKTWHEDIFLAKYDSSGGFLWVERPGGLDKDRSTAINLNTAGNIYLTGYFSETASFGSFTLGPVTQRNTFMVKYNPSGVVQWAQEGGGLYGTEGNGLSLDVSGNVYVIGTFIISATFGDTVLDATGLSEAFVTKIYVNATEIQLVSEQHPQQYWLLQNYPNPFNPTTTIEFALPYSTAVTLKIYNILGEEVSTLVSEELTAGNYEYNWDVGDMPSGIYLYRIKAGSFTDLKKMIFLR
jgi:hypothetical protein